MDFSSFLLVVDKRYKIGKRFNVLLRKNNRIPAIIYNNDKSIPISVDSKDAVFLLKMMSHGLRLIRCKLEEEFFVVIKDIHKHPYKNDILHFDFQRVEENDLVTLDISFRFIGERLSPGIKQGGFLIKYMSSLLVRSVASKIPKHIDIDLSQLNANESIFLSDLSFSNDVILPVLSKRKSSELLIASIIGARISVVKEVSSK